MLVTLNYGSCTIVTTTSTPTTVRACLVGSRQLTGHEL